MSIGDLRGRVIITNASAGTLRQVRSDLDGIANASRRISFANLNTQVANTVRSLRHQIDRLNRQAAPLAAGAAAAGLSVRGIIDQTKDFNEAKFGYGFATITDHIKEGKLELDGWKSNVNAVAADAIRAAKSFGTLPTTTMRAREEVEKLGFKGNESEGMFNAAIGLHLTEPQALSSGMAAKYLGAVYRAFEKQSGEEKEKLAKKMGADINSKEVNDAYIKSLAAKAAVAGAESALGPAEIVEGMRQYAPVWAQMGVSYDMSLAALAHGSNYGFRAPELGTAFKSMMNKVIAPTAQGLQVYDLLGINRQDFMTSAPVAPQKAANQLNSLFNGVFSKKGGKEHKRQILEMLDTAYRQGVTTTPEFQGALTQEMQRILGPGWAGRSNEVREGVSNATVSGSGGVKLFELIKAMRDKGATTGQIATAFEGRHIARYTPMFQFYDKLIAMNEKVAAAGPEVLDAAVEGRKDSEAGKTDALKGSFEGLMIALEKTGGVVDTIKTKLTELNNAMAGLPAPVLTGVTAGTAGLGALAAGGLMLGGLPLLWRMAKGAGRLGWSATGIPAAAGGIGAATGWALGRFGMLPTNVVGPSIGASGPILGAAATASRLGFWGGVRAIAIGGGRLLIPGLGIVSAAAMGYGAYQGYKQTGTLGGAVRGAIGLGDANAADGVEGMPPIGEFLKPGGAGGGAASEGQTFVDQLLAPIRSLDLSAEGARVADTFIAGFRGKIGEAAAASGEMANAMRSAAGSTGPSRVPLNTGPTMSGGVQ